MAIGREMESAQGLLSLSAANRTFTPFKTASDSSVTPLRHVARSSLETLQQLQPSLFQFVAEFSGKEEAKEAN